MKANARILGRSRVGTARIAQARIETAADDEPIDEKPKSVYEVVTRQMLEQVKADVNEVKERINTLLWLVIGAMLLELVMRVLK